MCFILAAKICFFNIFIFGQFIFLKIKMFRKKVEDEESLKDPEDEKQIYSFLGRSDWVINEGICAMKGGTKYKVK